MAHYQPKHRPPSGRSSYAAGPTPIADFLIGAWHAIFITAFGIVMAFVIAFALGSAVVYGIGEWTGATAAWAALVAEASGQPHDLIGIGAILAQNLLCGAIVSLLLATPALRRCLKRDSIKWLVKETGSPDAVAALRVGVTCLAISLAVAALLAAAGVILPAPHGFETVVAPHTFAATFLSRGGGGWPPGPGDLSDFALLLIVLLLVGGALIGIAIYSIAYGAAAIVGAQAASEGAGRGASALGASIAAVLCTGEAYERWNFRSGRMVLGGIVKGAAAGALYAIILLTGAAILGVG